MDFTTVDWPARLHGTDDELVFIGPLTADEQAEQDYWAAQYDGRYDTPEYLAFEEAQYAEHIGAAQPLMHCYLCYLDETGKADMSPKTDLGPLRGIVSEFTTNQRFDPTAAYVLTCGHTII